MSERLLTPVLTLRQAAELCNRKPSTVLDWVARGVWEKGKQYSKPRGAGRLYLRDGILSWINQQQPTPEPVPVQTHPKSTVNIALTPGVAAALEEQWAAAS